jgi:hypothetical protein
MGDGRPSVEIDPKPSFDDICYLNERSERQYLSRCASPIAFRVFGQNHDALTREHHDKCSTVWRVG